MRVAIIVKEGAEGKFRPWFEVKRALSRSGIKIRLGNDFKSVSEDVIVVQSNLVRGNEEAFRAIKRHPAVIVYEKGDCAPVGGHHWTRALLHLQNVKFWLKEIAFQDPSFHDRPVWRNRLHFTWLWDENGRAPQGETLPPIDEATLRKVRPFFPLYAYPLFDPCVGQSVSDIRERPIEVFFAGKVNYDLDIITTHRRRACSQIIQCNRRSVIATGRIPKRKYLEHLMLSKIFVSPYGYGMFSWKEFEAIYMGCVVVKPDASSCCCYGFDPYREEGSLVWCDPNFQDLSEVVTRVLEQEGMYARRATQAHGELNAKRDLTQFGADLVALLQSASN
jgi:hypothetical protein